MALLHIPGLEFSPELIYSVGSGWILFGVSYLLFRQAGRIANYSSGTLGALILTGGLGNTSFVGLPMIEVFYGAEFLGVVSYRSTGIFLILLDGGIALAALSSGK
jgi:predicted permease